MTNEYDEKEATRSSLFLFCFYCCWDYSIIDITVKIVVEEHMRNRNNEK